MKANESEPKGEVVMTHVISKSKVAWAIACAALLCTALLVGCSSSSSSSKSASASSASASASASSASASSAAAGETRTFTDSAGRTVEIPANIEKVAASGSSSQQILLTIAPDMLVGLTEDLNEGELKYFGDQYSSLPVFGQIYGGKGNFNKEAIAAASPQLIIDIGEAKDSIVEDLDELQESIGIPCVHIEASLGSYDEAYTLLGELLGKEDRAAELAAYCKSAYEEVESTVAAIPESDRVKAAYLLGDAGLNAMAKTSFQAAIIDMCADNVVVLEKAGGSGLGSEVSFEQVALWDPQLIVFGPGSIYATAGDDETWQTLTAIQNHNYYEVPGQPFNWMSTPPSVNQVMGLQWFARLCYPDKFDTDIATVTKSYYKTFYGYDMTDEEAAEFLANSLPTKAAE